MLCVKYALLLLVFVSTNYLKEISMFAWMWCEILILMLIFYFFQRMDTLLKFYFILFSKISELWSCGAVINFISIIGSISLQWKHNQIMNQVCSLYFQWIPWRHITSTSFRSLYKICKNNYSFILITLVINYW